MTAVEKPDANKCAKPSASPPRAAVYAVAALAIFIGGSTPTATKFAVLELDPVLVGVLRTALGAVMALPMVLLLRIPPPRGRRRIGWLALSASCGFIVFPVIFGIGQSLTSTAHSALIFAVVPIFVGVFASLLERRRLTFYWWVGGIVALIGEGLLFAFRDGPGSDGATLAGDAIVLAAVIVLGSGFVAGSRLTQEGYGPWGTTLWGLVAGGIVLTPFVPLAAADTGWHEAGAAAWVGLAYLVLMSAGLGYVCLYWAFGKGGIAKTGILYFVAPLITLGLAVAMLDETLTAPLLLAAGFVLGGVYISQRT